MHKLTKVDVASWFLVLVGMRKIMGMILAFSPRQIPPVIYQYMVSLEKLTRLVTKALGFELILLQKIVANSQTNACPLLSPERVENRCCTV